MTTETNKALLRYCLEAINEANFAALDDHPGFWETRQVVPPIRALFSDWHTTAIQQIAEDTKVFSYSVTQFTQIGPFAGVAPTGKRVSLEGFFLDQVVDGRVVEHNGTTAWPDVIRQLGHPAFQSWPTRTTRLLTQPLNPPEHDSTRLAANKVVIAQVLEALSRGDADVAAHHDGIGQLEEDFAAIRAAFPNLAYTLVMQVAEGNLVGTRATLRGTHMGELFGFAPSGKTITWDLFSLARIANGAVVEHNGSADWSAALIHLGLLTP